MSGSVLVMTYDTSTGLYKAGLLGSAQIADEAVVSGKIGSGGVGVTDLIADGIVASAKLTSAIISLLGSVADEAITSAKLASGAVGGVHILDGSIGSVDLGDGIVTSAKIAANAIGGPHILDGSILGADLADLAVVSAKIGALAVGTPHLAALGVTEAKVAAGAVTSGKIGANAIGGAHILDGSLTYAELADATLVSAKFGAGEIGDVLLKDFGLTSGKYASGSITEQALVSGISIDIAEISQEPSYRAQELVSAYLGIQFSVSGYFNYAQAEDINTMPAVGLAVANILSGQVGTFQHAGRLANAAWDFSGYVGSLLFLGTSSQVTLTAPSASGQCVQRIAKVIDENTIFVKPELVYVQLAE